MTYVLVIAVVNMVYLTPKPQAKSTVPCPTGSGTISFWPSPK